MAQMDTSSVTSSATAFVLWLSDMHLVEGINSLAARIDKLCAALNAHPGPYSSCTVVLSGDLAFSGKLTEYDRVTQILTPVLEKLSSLHGEVNILAVPGNHDCDLDSNEFRQEFIKANQELLDDTRLRQAAKAQTNFRQWEKSHPLVLSTEESLPLANWQVIDDRTNPIGFLLINTSALSVKHEIPNTLQVSLTSIADRPNGVEVGIAVMHHPLHWLVQSQRNELSAKLETACEVILTGHEHELDAFERHRPSNKKTLYLAAHALQDSSTPINGFSVLEVDSASRNFTQTVYHWERDMFKAARSTEMSLQKADERRKGLRPKAQFTEQLTNRVLKFKHRSGKELRQADVFVLPDLREASVIEVQGPSSNSYDGHHRTAGGFDHHRKPHNKKSTAQMSHVLVPGEDLWQRVRDNGTTIIMGDDKSGKTTLLGHLYDSAVSQGLYPLFVNARDCLHDEPSRVIENAVAAQYGTDRLDEYKQLNSSLRVLIVDDLDEISDHSSRLCAFAALANETFFTTVLAGTDFLLLKDPIQRVANETLWSFKHYEIMPFGEARQSALIKKWVAINQSLSDSERQTLQTQLEANLSELLSNRLLSPFPLYLLWLLDSLDSGEDVSEFAGAFGYHYQRMILQGVHTAMQRNPTKARKLTDDILLEILGRLAFRCFSAGSVALPMDDVRDAIGSVRHHKLLDFEDQHAVDLLVDADLIAKRSDKTYVFEHKYVYFYSVARYLHAYRRHSTVGIEVKTRLSHLMQNLHTEANANVLIFYVFLSRDEETIRELVNLAKSIFPNTEPSRFGEDFFTSKGDTYRGALTLPSNDVEVNREQLNSAKAQLEREELLEKEPDAELSELMELRKAMRAMQIIGQVLRVSPGQLDGEVKVVLATESFSLGLRTLTEMVGLVRRCEEKVEDYFKQIARGVVKDPSSLEAQVLLRKQMDDLLVFAGYAIVRRITRSVGSPHLRPVYGLVSIDKCDESVKLINKGITLEFFQELGAEATIKMYRYFRDKRYYGAAEVLRRIVWDHLYLYPGHGADRSAVCSALGIEVGARLLGGPQKLNRRSLPHQGGGRKGGKAK